MRSRIIKVAPFLAFAFASIHALSSASLQQSLEGLRDASALFLARSDVNVQLSGRVRHESFNFTSPLLFRYDYFDRYTFQRAKFNFDVDASYGTRRYGSSAVDSHLRLTSFTVIDNENGYTPAVEKMIYFGGKNYITRSAIDSHNHHGIVPLFFLENGYVDVKFEKFLPIDTPIHFKIGYIPYSVGRGISLGDYYGGAVDYLGWFEKGNLGNNTQAPGGLTLTMGDADSCAVEFYYSKWKCRSQGPDYTRREVGARRLDRDEYLKDPRAIQRGHSADRDLFALRGLITHKPVEDANYSAYIEPYLVYVDAPELNVEFTGDASARLGTVGCMVDWAYNGWAFNVEAAVQFGKQVMHPIDRNHVVEGDAYYLEAATQFGSGETAGQALISAQSGRLDQQIGIPTKYHSHVLIGITTDPTETDASGDYVLNHSQYLPYPAYYVPDELDHVNAHRSIEEQGKQIRTGAQRHATDTDIVAGRYYQSSKMEVDTAGGMPAANYSLYNSYTYKSGIDQYDALVDVAGVRPQSTLYNANIPFGGGKRFRDKYTLSLRGLMAMADLSYTMPSRSVTFAGTTGIITGDHYPFNAEEDKEYHGFVPLRDANYQGRMVKSYAVFAARRIARPSTFADPLLYAPNNYEDSSNVQFLGGSVVFRPCKNRDELHLETNLLYFWQDVPPFIWDKTATRDFGDTYLNGIWNKIQSDYHFSGYQLSIPASRQLGLEVNTVFTWTPIPSIEIHGLFAIFLPGQLYRDIDGMPNQYAIRTDMDGDVHLDSLGHRIAFGGMIRLTYFF